MVQLGRLRSPVIPGLLDPVMHPVTDDAPVVRPWRLTRATTKAAWYAVRDQLAAHEQAVFWGLLAFWNRKQFWPTGMELFEFLVELRTRTPLHPRYCLIHDINNVRPRLTTMNQRDPAIVVTGQARLCTSKHATLGPDGKLRPNTRLVLTWRVPQIGEPVRDGRPPETRVVAA